MDGDNVIPINSELVKITPCESLDFSDKKYTKLELTIAQQSKINQFISQMPTMIASSALTNAWQVNWPEGVQGHLMAYKAGGYGTTVMNENGIVAHASITQLQNSMALLNTFSAMSIATGQYFLAQISSQLTKINQSLDSILGFLYGDKKAELLSEVSFVQYAYKNFASIMEHDAQRVATISSLQQARIIAMKDIEFYLQDLQTKSAETPKKFQSFEAVVHASLNIRDSLDLSMQLFALSSVMESSYSRNTDPEYLDATKTDVIRFVNKCESRMLQCFSGLRKQLDNYKPNAIDKFDSEPLRKELDNIITARNDGQDSPLRKAVESIMANTSKPHMYILSKSGTVYLADA